MIRMLIVFALLAAAGLQGCSPTNHASLDSPAAEPKLPDWVLVVPVEEDGLSVFVGGCSMALSAAEGIEAAQTEAELQITSAARSLFTDIFAIAPRASGVTTTSIDRLDFREMGFELYADAMVRQASLDRVYVRSCETGEVWESSGMPVVELIDGAVCSVFVRVTFDADAWERNLSETLREMRRKFRSQGRESLIALADWTDGHLAELLAGDDAPAEGADARN